MLNYTLNWKIECYVEYPNAWPYEGLLSIKMNEIIR